MNVDSQVKKLIAAMTLEEKVGQLEQSLYVREERDKLLAEARAGRIGAALAATRAPMSVQERNELQKAAIESRLGIPIIFGYDVIHGYRTIFPIPLAQSCSWEPQLACRVAYVAAKEATSGGIDWTFAPMVDIARDARWGRIAEGFGEDPHLASAFTAAAVHGFQGDNLADPAAILACLKHFAAYGAAEGGRDYNVCELSERALREVYLPPFRAGIEAGAQSLMSGYHEVSGVPATANRHILTDILRKEWKFDGFVVSDYAAINELIMHGVAADQAEAAGKALDAGVDMDMVCRCYWKLPELLKKRKISPRQIDAAVARILRVKFRCGLFDHPFVDEQLHKTTLLAKEHIALAAEASRRTIVLLKNDGNILPLPRDMSSLAVIGPIADNQFDLLGSWRAIGQQDDVVSLLTGIKEKVSGRCKLAYAKGCGIIGDSTDGFAEAVRAAQSSDTVILAVGESLAMSGEANCRADLGLPGVQQQLVETVAALGKPVIVVLFAGRPLSISWIAKNVPAILMAWQPGIEAGHAVADVLFGDCNPSAKLTTTWPYQVGQVPIYYNHKNTGRPPADDNPRSSKYLDAPYQPLYPFGFGLSYTTFEYSNLKLSRKSVKPNGSLKVRVDLKNTGSRAGEEIVQLYVRDLVGSVTRPVKELKDFRKIALKPGEKTTVSFVLEARNLAFWGPNNRFIVEPGKFKLWVGPDSARGLEAHFTIVPRG